MSKWIPHNIGQGVVITRQDTALRNGELQASTFARLQPGNTEQIYPDRAYSHTPLEYGSNHRIIYTRMLNFEGGKEWLLVVKEKRQVSVAGLDEGPTYQGSFDLFDLNNIVSTDAGARPNRSVSLNFAPTGASRTNRGAEYFLGIAGTADPANGTQVKAGAAYVLSYDEDNAEVAVRKDGFEAADALEVDTHASLPELSSDLWDYTALDSDATDDAANSTAYNWRRLINSHLYGSFANRVVDWDTQAERAEADQSMMPAVNYPLTLSGDGHGTTMDLGFDLFVDVVKIELKMEGSGYVFAYWATEYDSDLGVESAPSSLATLTTGDPNTARWEITLDWESIFKAGRLEAWAANFYPGLPISEGIVKGIVNSLRSEMNNGNIPRLATGSMPFSDAQREAMTSSVNISGGAKNFGADDIRIYRQNLGFYDRFLVAYEPSTGNTPFPSDPVGEGPRNAEDITAGRITRQGGLLTSFPITDLPKTYEDNLLESGITDPGFAYPTVTYIQRGGLAVFDYLRQAAPYGVSANMAQSLLRVEHRDRADGGVDANNIMVSPVEDPEQSPLIWAIPVVTERQDTITAIQTLRDLALIMTSETASRLNYIPFEGSNQQDRVLTQITGNHGVPNNNRITVMEGARGQLVAWLSQSGLVGSNGNGFFDLCPDFSVDAATKLGFNFDNAQLVNNAAEYRLELWTGNYRWDFLYHPTQMKDVRGDGLGLTMKLMGPTPWYQNGNVVGACAGTRSNVQRTFHIYRSKGGGHTLAESTDNLVDGSVSVTLRKYWGSDPTTRLKSKRVGTQFTDDAKSINIVTISTSPDGGAEQRASTTLQLDYTTNFSSMTVMAMGGSQTYSVGWTGGAIGPFWSQVEEARGAGGR